MARNALEPGMMGLGNPGEPRWQLTQPWKMSWPWVVVTGTMDFLWLSIKSWERPALIDVNNQDYASDATRICQFHHMLGVSCLSRKMRSLILSFSHILRPGRNGSKPLKNPWCIHFLRHSSTEQPSHMTLPGSACRPQRRCAACSAAFVWKTPRCFWLWWMMGQGWPLWGCLHDPVVLWIAFF